MAQQDFECQSRKKVVVLVGDEPKPDSRFNFNVHSALVSHLNRHAIAHEEKANFFVEPGGEVVSSISALAYLKKYQNIIGFSGTTCKGRSLKFIKQGCQLAVHAIPSNKASLRQDYPTKTCGTESNLFGELYKKLAQKDVHPQLIILKDAKVLGRFKGYLATKPELKLPLNFLKGDLTENEKERIQQRSGQEFVIPTPIAERGVDFDAENLEVTQAYPCASDNREQAKGRTARKVVKGRINR